MALRQQQIVLIGSVLLLGYMTYGSLNSSSRTRRPRTAAAPDFESHPAPRLDLALPRERLTGSLERALFSPPQDTRPLPALAFVAPPLLALESLRPSPAPGPSARLFGELLRGDLDFDPFPGLFEETEALDSEEAGEFAVGDLDDDSPLSPEERLERIAGYKRTYDSINIGQLHFGQIRNADRFKLEMRGDEGILFLEFDPATGLERWPGQEPILFARERVQSFEFAQTTENEVEFRSLRFAGQVSGGQYLNLMAFADWCFAQADETPVALEMAARMYTKAVPLDPDDPQPLLRLALCHEWRFEFEEAFTIYANLLQGRFANHPLALASMAALEQRFRMTSRAEEHFRAALSYGRSEWEVQWRYGRFLLDQERFAEAAEHLIAANRFEPSEAEYQGVRAEMRTDLANALCGLGQLDEAERLYGRALQADSSFQRALAGLVNMAYLRGTESNDAATGELESEGAGFELLLARGLASMQSGDAQAAKQALDLALQSDPLRAALAWRALSYLAERTGHAEEALEYIDLAELNEPGDAYTLFQRGRLLAQRDDVDGARAAFTKALDTELAMPDVLAALGLLELSSGDFESAELYFGRSLSLDNSQAGVHALRGLGAVFSGHADAAEDHFDEALRLDGLHPVAGCGRAWCSYASGDAIEAMTRFREFEDSRRHLSEEDPYRVYALDQIDRIGEHNEKVVWTDTMERQELRNGWGRDEEVGPEIFMRDGKVLFEGSFTRSGRTRLRRGYNSGDLVSFEAKLRVHSRAKSRVGIFLALERRSSSRGASKISAEVVLSRNIDGTIQYRSMRRGQEGQPYIDSRVLSWPDDEEITLRLERYGTSAKTAIRILVNGVPIVDSMPMPALGATSREVQVGIFAEGDPGHTVHLEVDDVEVVRRDRK
ncbi:MAG: tetratricopeptide repeat protein [bacterium]|nr:tetratricopeptide repeat protein [Planctomycetota bacterium]HIL51937.1 tetratricopeptide repeat protein [Planctomycetota bacterium]